MRRWRAKKVLGLCSDGWTVCVIYRAVVYFTIKNRAGIARYALLHGRRKPVPSSGSIRIGCCGFAGPQKEYAKSFRVVEVQQTFYEPPQLSTAQRWRAEAPHDFEFSLKAWQLITHESTSPTYRRLRTVLHDGARMCVGSFKPTEDVWKAWLRTKEIAVSLKARIVVFQCPASFEPSEKNKANLRKFFTAAREDIDRFGQEMHFGWEPRGEWQKRDIGILCNDLHLLHVVDPFRHETVTSGEFYYRLHGTANYRHRYTDEELAHLMELTESRGPGYCMFNNLSMKEDALRFAAVLSAQCRGI